MIFSFFFLVPISGNSATFEFLNQVRGIDTGNGLVGCEAVYVRGKNLVDGYSFSDAVTNSVMLCLFM